MSRFTHSKHNSIESILFISEQAVVMILSPHIYSRLGYQDSIFGPLAYLASE